jgi:hypothetical protein
MMPVSPRDGILLATESELVDASGEAQTTVRLSFDFRTVGIYPFPHVKYQNTN